MEYTLPVELLGVVAGLYVIGRFMKGIPNIPNWVIPFGLLILGVLASIFICGPNVEGVIGGVVATGLSVYGNEMYKQILKGINGSD